MNLFGMFRPATPAPTPSDAGRALAALGRDQRILRNAMTDRLRTEVAGGGNAGLGWRL